MVGMVGVEPTSQVFQARAKTASATSPMVVKVGIEPTTPAFSGLRSTNELQDHGKPTTLAVSECQ